jgi:ankyrin repeat protein
MADDLPAKLHELLDIGYGADGASSLGALLDEGADPNARVGPLGETALHVATRRRRVEAVQILLDRGAEIEAKTTGGKTAFVHAARRGFADVAGVLAQRGAATNLDGPDLFAVAVAAGQLDPARALLAANPGFARTGNPEEDRLLADVAGRPDTAPVELLIEAGADLAARGLDDGTPLHQAAWFGQPANVRLLIDAGAPLDVFESVHGYSPIGWAAHGSQFSGGAAGRQAEYVALTRMLLDAGASLEYPAGEAVYLDALLQDASEEVAALIREAAP